MTTLFLKPNQSSVLSHDIDPVQPLHQPIFSIWICICICIHSFSKQFSFIIRCKKMIDPEDSIGTPKRQSKGHQKNKKDLMGLKRTFSQELKYSQRVLHIVEENSLENHTEKDIGLIKDLLEIWEHSKNLEKKQTAKKFHFDEKLYHFVEETGELHHQANKFNSSILKEPNEIDSQDKCPCGCNRAKGDKLSYCLNVEKNYFFGQGIILFFYFSTRVLLLMFPIVLVYGIYSLVTNMISDRTLETCEKPGALAFLCQLKIQAEVNNKRQLDQLLVGQLCLGLVMCFIWSLGMRLIRRIGMIKGQQIDDMLLSSSDFFLFMEKLPIGEYTEDNILEFIHDLWENVQYNDKRNLQIKAVEIIYNMSEFRQKISKIRSISKQLLLCVNQKEIKDLRNYFQAHHKIPQQYRQVHIKPELEDQYLDKKKQLAKAYEQATTYRQKFLNDKNFRKTLTSECALVEFSDKHQLEIFLQKYGMNKTTWIQYKIIKIKKKVGMDVVTQLFMGREIRMYKAPEPSDIFWVHCEKKVRLRRTAAVWLINLFLTGCSFGILYLLKWISSQNPDIPALSILTIIGINLFNRFIWRMLLKVVFIEQNYTKTINIISVMNKSYFSQLINIIIIPIILNIGISDNLHGATGLAGQAHDFQITVFLFMTLFNLINVPNLYIKFLRGLKPLRRFTIRYMCRATGQIDTFEEMKDALVFLYDPPVVPVAGFYVYITTVIAQAFFFCHLHPILLLYLIGNLILFFLMNKYIVIQMSKMTDLLDITVFHHISTLALNIPFVYGIGSIVFLAVQQKYHFGYYVPSVLCFVIGFLSIQSPFKLYAKMLDFILKHFPLIPTHKKPEQRPVETQEQLRNPEINQKQVDVKKEKDKKPEKAKRLQNYYGAGIGTNQLFNFENRLQQVKGKYHGQYKQFCLQFDSHYYNKLKEQKEKRNFQQGKQT